MRTKTSALIALPTALLLALSLSACDEDAVSTTTDSSSSSSDDSSTPSDNESQDSKDSDDASPSSKASASSTSSSSATADPNARTVTIEDLKAGDCISEVTTDSQDSQESISSTTVVDCSTPHQYEMIGTGTTTAATHAEANTSKEMAKVCSPLLTKYVGSSAADKYSVLAATPVQEAWDQGDRSFVCVAQNADESPLNNSIKNS